MYDMKEFNVRHLQHNLAAVLESVERGEKVRITRRGKVVAQLGPPEPDPAELSWPDSLARLQRLAAQMGEGAADTPASRIIEQDRQERF
jgi:prevent-host-death family protein